MRFVTLLAVTVLLLTTRTTFAEEIANGLYSLTDTGIGVIVHRGDAGGQVILLKRLAAELKDVSIKSDSNDSSSWRISATVAGVAPDQLVGPHAIVVKGIALPVFSTGAQDGSTDAIVVASIRGEKPALEIAAELKVTPKRREHPGYRLAVSFSADQAVHAPGNPIVLTLTLTNVGDTTIRFMDGGSQRGARNNQFGFTCFSMNGNGKPIADTGDPVNFGGMSQVATIEPGGKYTKVVTLDNWFKLTETDTYKIVGTFHLPFLGADSMETIWEDFATATCAVEVAAPAP